MTRNILHIDFNNFYASVECAGHPEYENIPVVVGGDEELRHGIVLSKNEVAKHRYQVKTGEVLWKVRERCPELVVLKPHMEKYMQIFQMSRELYYEYTDRVESFGMDEAWLDVTGSEIFGTPRKIADELRERVRREFGITASVGVSFNKIFAKLGSDLKKPDATTVIAKENYQERIWGLPVGELLYVGRATQAKLARVGINTIGDLANYDRTLLQTLLGKQGILLWAFANGLDSSPVARATDEAPVKSIGNSTTPCRDLLCDEDAKFVFYALADSVAERLRKAGFNCRTISIHVRDCDLVSFERQRKLDRPTCLSGEIAECAMALFRRNYHWARPIRSLGITLSDLTTDSEGAQFDLFGEMAHRDKKERAEYAVDQLRTRYGHDMVRRASMLVSPELTGTKLSSGNFMQPLPIVRNG